MVSAKTIYYIRVSLTPIFCLINGASAAYNLYNGHKDAGITLAASAIVLLIFLVMVVRLGYKPIPQLVSEEMERSAFISTPNDLAPLANQGGVINQVSVPYEMRASHAETVVLEQQTIFRSHPAFFIFIGVLMSLAAIAGGAWYCKKAIDDEEPFKILESGNKWVPFIGCLATLFPSLDVVKVAFQTRRAVSAYLNGGGSTFV